MGSTSEDHQSLRDSVTSIPDSSTFDFHQGLADTALRRDDTQLYENRLEVASDCHGLPSPSRVDASPATATDLFHISENEDCDSTSTVTMELLTKAEQEAEHDKAGLLLVYSKAKVDGNCITVFHYRTVVKLLLYHLKLSENRMEAVPHPKATARLLCRLSRELKSVSSFQSDNLFDKFSDPTDYDGCLGEMLSDMEEHIKLPEPLLPDGYVYVRRGTDTYAQSLLAAADELSTSSSRGS